MKSLNEIMKEVFTEYLLDINVSVAPNMRLSDLISLARTNNSSAPDRVVGKLSDYAVKLFEEQKKEPTGTFEIYFAPDGEMYNQAGLAISFLTFLELLKKNGIEIDKSTEKRKYSILHEGDISYTDEEGDCEVLKIHTHMQFKETLGAKVKELFEEAFKNCHPTPIEYEEGYYNGECNAFEQVFKLIYPDKDIVEKKQP